MSSETWIVGGSESDKRAIGSLVRQSVAGLGSGHVEALVENRGPHPFVTSAHAWTTTPINSRDLCRKIQEGLNK